MVDVAGCHIHVPWCITPWSVVDSLLRFWRGGNSIANVKLAKEGVCKIIGSMTDTVINFRR